ncbi:putative metal-dependent protease molecular chaperone [Wigglesworthia glossinidia endosymbiont of Glossina morsitans morsitans (Yale colony)]|uniref:tRNA threonylcarbamoyladenosine biosynthesis protein TsaB n=1 Tax=Wigglesworthia glossinidia endosymbiont of Glossina morsitans morsitans (Yale colony) TaxID=1142511 RepID=H6Q4U3_WIGGL|nr:tRNA (adenosine(37)-N6)-threonylcarbamoyltransferase complex dimerization subunit type 1 TsaB [Wigglesworthia glossinidia]AFA41226.1 putative metal-dependent protease molecular chaperone [Wigglesworthia glossinidia endosymbiont of Glossina morsitans morsitans (Yale colony)]
MNFLALDFTNQIYSVTCMKNNKISTEYKAIKKENTKYILYAIKKTLHDVNLLLSNVNYFVFNKGPGSLLGLRISIAIIQGLSFANNLPVLGISALHILAQKIFTHTNCKKVLIAINFSKNLINWAVYQKDNNTIEILKEHFSTPKKLLSLIYYIPNIQIISGNSWEKYQSLKNFVQINANIVYVKNIFSSSQDIVTLANFCFSHKKNFLCKELLYKKNFFNF